MPVLEGKSSRLGISVLGKSSRFVFDMKMKATRSRLRMRNCSPLFCAGFIPEFIYRMSRLSSLIDIGGWTVDLMRLDNAVPNAGTCRSLELGVIRCMDEILEQVRRNTGLSVTETQIERVLGGSSAVWSAGGESLDPETRQAVY